jgi:NADPH-dependent glutamate synthase beta subunit-like oxidoreductase
MDRPDSSLISPDAGVARPERALRTLTPQQVLRIAARGRRRPTARGEVLEDLGTAGWTLTRPPYLLETNRPGVFAVGDVRGGNVKRVASAVGEGSIAVAFVHQALHQ